MTVLSIVTPCYNEEAGIAECYEAVRAVMESELRDFSYEHIFIDNCSQDATVAILRDIAGRDKRVKVIVNSRNFGPARSPFHAVLQTRGDATIPMLADLQTPPALIPRMVELWRQGAKVVIAVKRQSDERMFWRHARSAYYRILKSSQRWSRSQTSLVTDSMTAALSTPCASSMSPNPIFGGSS